MEFRANQDNADGLDDRSRNVASLVNFLVRARTQCLEFLPVEQKADLQVDMWTVRITCYQKSCNLSWPCNDPPAVVRTSSNHCIALRLFKTGNFSEIDAFVRTLILHLSASFVDGPLISETFKVYGIHNFRCDNNRFLCQS